MISMIRESQSETRNWSVEMESVVKIGILAIIGNSVFGREMSSVWDPPCITSQILLKQYQRSRVKVGEKIHKKSLLAPTSRSEKFFDEFYVSGNLLFCILVKIMLIGNVCAKTPCGLKRRKTLCCTHTQN